MVQRRTILRRLLLYGSGFIAFGRPGKAFSWLATAKALGVDGGIAGDSGELLDVAFAVIGMT
ncbi:MAG TPA: hypothetical protein VKA68_06055 [bacterium]|nr:hypothetical protein [bacterium]